VGELTWSFESVGRVNASRERVIALWFNPERAAQLRFERRNRAERNGVDVSHEAFTKDGIRVNVTKWKDKKGWGHDTRSEIVVDANGKPLPEEDGSFPLQVVHVYISPLHYKVRFTCLGGINFTAQPDGSTEVRQLHDHRVSGGTKPNREGVRRSHGPPEPDRFQEMLDKMYAEIISTEAERHT
jgi:hypothetical protein